MFQNIVKIGQAYYIDYKIAGKTDTGTDILSGGYITFFTNMGGYVSYGGKKSRRRGKKRRRGKTKRRHIKYN